MKWLKIGNTTLNMNQVRRIDDNVSHIAITFVPNDYPALPVNLQLEGEEAEALRRWVNKQAKALMPDQNKKKDRADRPVDETSL